MMFVLCTALSVILGDVRFDVTLHQHDKILSERDAVAVTFAGPVIRFRLVVHAPDWQAARRAVKSGPTRTEIPGVLTWKYWPDFNARHWRVTVSAASVGALLALCALPWLHRHARRWWRAAHTRCVTCGYNLTGNVTGRCPECATPLPDVVRNRLPGGR